MIQDISRPDVGGIPPKMQALAERVAKEVGGLTPWMRVTTDDNFCSSIFIRGSYQLKEQWANGIFENSDYFLIKLAPKTRYYSEGQEIGMEMVTSHGVAKMRRYHGPVDKVLEKVIKWIKSNTL
jgi:hypothetical protein